MKNILLAITGLLLILVTSAGCSKETTEKIKQRRGAQIYLQKGEPVFDFGSIGDFYIDKNTGLLYGPKTVIGWGENPISLVDNDDENYFSNAFDSSTVERILVPSQYLAKYQEALSGTKYEDKVQAK